MSIRSNVDARALDQRIAFERRVEVPTGTGGTTITWQRLGPSPTSLYWARVDGARASEPYVAEGIRSVSEYTFWIRADVYARLGLLPTDRIYWNGKPFNIVDMPDQQLRGRLIALGASTGLSDG